MNVSFSGEAGDTLANLLNALGGYTVKVTPDDDTEPYVAQLVGPDPDGEWTNDVLVRKCDENDEPIGEPFRVTARDLYVYQP